jgi:hypothetical protein
MGKCQSMSVQVVNLASDEQPDSTYVICHSIFFNRFAYVLGLHCYPAAFSPSCTDKCILAVIL